ncbi:hypothetical protein VP01_7g21 [Puccinia sorghi]|uniref:Uncharacterized protein n=1 Tax=Puccinia sorghi TaxID=27349 RepID=A0A0L6UAN5_9BASI|nr:hypothetical protein VP01_7g21 [Puccinia sorghi]
MAVTIWVENNKPYGNNHWMSMPTTVHLLVELYNKTAVYFSSYWTPKIFVPLKIEDETLFPAPQYENNWEKIVSQEALKWKDKYARCCELT